MSTPGILSFASPLDHVVAHEIARIGSLSITNHMAMTVVGGLIMLIAFPLILCRRRVVPTGAQNFIETVCVYFRDEVARPFLHEHTDRFAPFIWTTFFFILTSNLLGLVPVASILYILSLGRLEGFGGTATGNIYVTGALAAVTLVTIHVSGVWNKASAQRQAGRSWRAALIVGFLTYCYNMVPRVEGVIGVLLFPLLFGLEIVGTIVKGMALAIRLFANMMAGHTLLAVLLLLISLCKTLRVGIFVTGISIVGSVAISCLELFVAFLQAYIFTFLTTIFIGMAVHQEH